jgi:nitrogen fixation NifU-like protein
VRTTDGRIEDISFEGEGCAISQAAASMLTEALKGKAIDEARALLDAYQKALTEGGGDEQRLGHLAALLGVKRFPMRVKCATLAAHTLRSALEGGSEPVSTE